jgi:hypothetical protein
MIQDILGRFKAKRDVVPSTEAVNHIVCAELEQGASYIVKEAKPEFSFEVFTSLVKGKCRECDQSEAFHCESIGCEGCTLICPCKNCRRVRAQGICFTTRFPLEIRDLYTIQTTPIFWISSHGADAVTPYNLELMADMIWQFFKRSKRPVLLFDGVEYLIVIHGFLPVLKFIRDLQEGVIINRAILIMPINPMALGEKELALLERDMRELSEGNY